MRQKTKADVKRSPITVDSLSDLIRRGNDGGEQALSEIRDVLNGPDAGMLVKSYGDLAVQVQSSIVKSVAVDQPVFETTLHKKLELLRSELAGQDPSPLESLLVERVVICWLQTTTADLRAAHTGNCSPSQHNHIIHQQDRAHRRLMSAIKTLATIRKMAMPRQVNIDANIKMSGKSDDVIGPPTLDHKLFELSSHCGERRNLARQNAD